jgi:hypothetical protein
LKYAYLDEKNIYSVIISANLSAEEEEKLLEVLKAHRSAIGYSLDDLKGISPALRMHKINLEEDAKPVVYFQRRLIRLKRIYNFLCSMLVYTPFALCFVTLRDVFYAFSGTNLLTRCQSASSLFSTIFVFQKSYTGNILRIGRNKSRTSYFYRSFTKTEDETKGGQAHHMVARPSPWPFHHMVRLGGPPSNAALSPISSPRRKKAKGRISFPPNILQAAAVAVARLGGSRSSSRQPAGGLLHHHGRLRSDV